MAELLFDGPRESPLTLVLAHGAGAPMDAPFMNDVAARVGRYGWRVARFEFPYMAARRSDGRRRRPDPPARLEAAWLAVVEELSPASQLVVGGKSMGGRIASRVADRAGVAGLVCLGYPFHPPGRPERLRTAHLAELTTPTLVLQGERDPFGTRDEVHTYSLSDAIEVVWLPDGDHSLKPRKRSGFTLEAHLETAAGSIDRFLTGLAGRRP